MIVRNSEIFLKMKLNAQNVPSKSFEVSDTTETFE